MIPPLAAIRRASRPTRLLGVIVLGATLASCGGDSGSASGDGAGDSAPPAPSVEIERSRFSPVELTVESGTVVAFTNLDPFEHTVTAADGSSAEFDSEPFGQDETFTQQFDEPGTHRYFCEIHPTMRGTIVVE